MIKNIYSFAILVMILSGCSTLDVVVDYDEKYDFNKANKVIVVHKSKANENTLVNDRIINALNASLEAKNYKTASLQEADLIFVFSTNVQDKTQINTEYYSMGRRYRYSGMMTSTTSTYNYTQGTIVIDAINPRTNKIVWRGVGKKELNEKKSPQERTESINNVINEIMGRFPTKKLSK